jgi:hypothetical protein
MCRFRINPLIECDPSVRHPGNNPLKPNFLKGTGSSALVWFNVVWLNGEELGEKRMMFDI